MSMIKYAYYECLKTITKQEVAKIKPILRKYSQTPISWSHIGQIFTSWANLRGASPLATNLILFLCVSWIYEVRYLHK